MRKLLVISLLSILSTSSANAYKVGDTISSEIANKLKLVQGITIVGFFVSWFISSEKELPLVNDLSMKIKLLIFHVKKKF